MRVGYDLSETIAWKLSGNQGNKWLQGQAPLMSSGQNIEVNEVINILHTLRCRISGGS